MESAQLLDNVQSLFPSYATSAAHCEWWSAPIEGKVGSLRITPQCFQRRDDFSKLILSTISFVHDSELSANSRTALTAYMESCELALGIVVEPEFDSDERYNDLVFAIAKELSGLVFNGNEFLKPDGSEFS